MTTALNDFPIIDEVNTALDQLQSGMVNIQCDRLEAYCYDRSGCSDALKSENEELKAKIEALEAHNAALENKTSKPVTTNLIEYTLNMTL